MNRPVFLACLACLASAPAALAQSAPERGKAANEEGRSINATEAAQRVEKRWRGDILSIELVTAETGEDAEIVWSIRLLSPSGSLIVIRLDAASGAYLGARGEGLLDARRLPDGG